MVSCTLENVEFSIKGIKMKELNRHVKWYSFLRGILKPIFIRKFNFKYESGGNIEGPFLLLVNHNMELDAVLTAIAFPKHMYFVASEHIMRKGIATKLLMYFIKPIIRKKGKVEVKTVSETLRTLRGGTSVCIFAEGNRSFNGRTMEIIPSTGKMAKRSGVKLVTYKLEGGYFTQPRWSTTLRRGLLTGKVVNVYEAEQLKAMSEAEVNEAICRDLYEDAYETQQIVNVPFKGKKLAYGMESTLYMCPKCGVIGTLKSDDTSISCECGLKYTYDEYGYLTDEDGNKKTVTEWDIWQHAKLDDIISSWQDDKPVFTDEVTLYSINEEHDISNQEKGTLESYSDRINCCGTDFYFDDMLGFSIISRNVIVMHYGNNAEQYEIRGELTFNALKYLYVYEKSKGEV